MASIANCPECQQSVLVLADDDSAAHLRCPHCRAEFAVADILMMCTPAPLVAEVVKPQRVACGVAAAEGEVVVGHDIGDALVAHEVHSNQMAMVEDLAPELTSSQVAAGDPVDPLEGVPHAASEMASGEVAGEGLGGSEMVAHDLVDVITEVVVALPSTNGEAVATAEEPVAADAGEPPLPLDSDAMFGAPEMFAGASLQEPGGGFDFNDGELGEVDEGAGPAVFTGQEYVGDYGAAEDGGEIGLAPLTERAATGVAVRGTPKSSSYTKRAKSGPGAKVMLIQLGGVAGGGVLGLGIGYILLLWITYWMGTGSSRVSVKDLNNVLPGFLLPPDARRSLSPGELDWRVALTDEIPAPFVAPPHV